MTATRERLEAPLIAAREALRHAKATTLQELGIVCERAYLAAHKTYETEYRQAGTNHGLAITRALAGLDQRKLTLDARMLRRQVEHLVHGHEPFKLVPDPSIPYGGWAIKGLPPRGNAPRSDAGARATGGGSAVTSIEASADDAPSGS